ncbi:MAG: hypothetical protein ACFFB3_18650 [Candidatus Hodarchaeota archaeon]
MPTKKRNHDENSAFQLDRQPTDLEEIRRLVNLVGGTLEDEEDTEFLLAALGLPQRERKVIIRNLYS